MMAALIPRILISQSLLTCSQIDLPFGGAEAPTVRPIVVDARADSILKFAVESIYFFPRSQRVFPVQVLNSLRDSFIKSSQSASPQQLLLYDGGDVFVDIKAVIAQISFGEDIIWNCNALFLQCSRSCCGNFLLVLFERAVGQSHLDLGACYFKEEQYQLASRQFALTQVVVIVPPDVLGMEPDPRISCTT
jgi:hypothetical protein